MNNISTMTGGYARPTLMAGRKQIRTLTIDELRGMTPSVFADRPYEGTSSKYSFIPTDKIVVKLMDEGFFPTAAFQSSARIPGKKDFTKHVIKFRRDSVSEVDGLIPELIVGNSHDASSQFWLSFGLLRLVCMNGLMVADSSFENIKVRHSGDIIDQVIEGSYSVIERVPQVLERVQEFKGVHLSAPEINAFNSAALMLRYDKDEAPITADKLNERRRYDDTSNDLWTAFNRTQENLIKGGVRGRNKSNGRMSTRAINSVSENVRINKSLWELTEQMAKIKNGTAEPIAA